MNKKCFYLALSAVLLALSLPARAQQPGKIHRIGYLSVRWPDTEKSYLPAFQQGLGDLGYLEGKNIVIEYRWAERRGRERQSALAAELLRHKVELIVTGGAGAAREVQRLSETIPIVMAEATAPVARGLVQSLARPGGNTTGLSMMPPELFAKWLELLKEIVPNLYVVAVLWNPNTTTSRLGWNSIQLPARQLGIQLHSMEVRIPDDLEKAFEDAARAGAAALVRVPGSRIGANRSRLADLAVKSRLPAIYSSAGHVRAGGLMSYGASMAHLYRRAATYVDKILKGAKPADLPVEQPTKYT
ncbi:MAG: ABC transporter substrate-binding protein, partial [Candidatus Binatia bacterium]